MNSNGSLRVKATSGRAIRNFFIGFLGWFVVNTLLWVGIRVSDPGTLFMNPLWLMPLLVNIVTLLALYRSQRWITLGIVSALIVNAIGTFLVTPVNVPFSTSPVTEIIRMTPFFPPGLGPLFGS